MVIGLILCLIGNYICCYFVTKVDETEKDLKKRKNKSNVLFVTAVILSIIASVLLIKIIDSNSNGVGAAKYNYYINGKKVSSQTYAGTQNMFLGIMFFGAFFGSGMTLSANIIKRRKNKKQGIIEEKKPNTVTFVLSIISIIFGLMLIFSGISVLTNKISSTSNVSPIIAIILAFVCIDLGIWGIVTFIKRKKKNS